MGQIIDNQPSGGRLIDNQPSGAALNQALSNKLITRGVEEGSPMGLLLAITYTADETFTTEYNP